MYNEHDLHQLMIHAEGGTHTSTAKVDGQSDIKQDVQLCL